MENPNIIIATDESFENEVRSYNFNYDDLTIEFSPDKTKIKFTKNKSQLVSSKEIK